MEQMKIIQREDGTYYLEFIKWTIYKGTEK